MVNQDFINILNTALVTLAARYGVPESPQFEQHWDDTCRVGFAKDIANTHAEGINSIVDEIGRMDGIVDVGDTTRDSVFKGCEKRYVYFSVSKKNWKKCEIDRKLDDEFDSLIAGDPEAIERENEKVRNSRAEMHRFFRDYLIPIPEPSYTRPTELYLPLAYEPYDEIASGEKKTEFRDYCETWVKRILANIGTLKKVRFQRGYGGRGRALPEQMVWTIKKIDLYDIETRASSDPINVTEGFIPTHIAIDLGIRLDDIGSTNQKDN